MDELSLRDGRYDGIFHLVTAACEAEEHYSLDNNEARTESVEVARDVRRSIRVGHVGHDGMSLKREASLSSTRNIPHHVNTALREWTTSGVTPKARSTTRGT